jgi:hypothetical protein
MKALSELFNALLDGKTLKSKVSPSLSTGIYINESGELVGIEKMGSLIPSLWEIKDTTEWYDNIPRTGVLCWCGDSVSCDDEIENASVQLVMNYIPDDSYKFKTRGCFYKYAYPLIAAEINVYLEASSCYLIIG